MTASFGVLKDETLELTPGLNVIEAPNDSGKSTWCAFARTMLYGPESRRSREGKHWEKQYAPWDGAPMSGEMELRWAGKDITLRRSDGPAGPMRSLQAVYTGTNIPVTGLNEADAGELLTGLTADVFARTAFIGPAGLGVEQSEELEKKISSLVTSGEEGPGFSRAAEELRALRRRCRYHNKGLLPNLEQEMGEIVSALEQLRELSSQLEDTELREEELKESLSARADDRDREREYLDARQRAAELERELLRREREAARLDDELRRSALRGREADETEYKAMRADHRRAKELEKAEQTPSRAGKLPLVLFLLGALLAAGGIFLHALLFAAALAFAGAAAGWIMEHGGGRKENSRELDRLLKKYGARSAGEIPRRYEKYAACRRELRSLQASADELSGQLETARSRAAELEKSVPSVRESEETEAELRRAAESKARLRGRLEAMGDGAALQSRYNSLREEHARLERKCAALDTALRELEAADEEMHSRFAPALSRAAESIFRRLTGERYISLAFDRDLSAAARPASSALPREETYLSRGTRDQLYLSLRLALCELTAGEEGCPIILDDALLTFDDERLGYAMEYLRELSERRQIILFTCQSREKRYLEQ